MSSATELSDLAAAGSPPPGGHKARAVGRPKGHNSGDTRRLLLDAALDAFAEHGYDGVGTRDLARCAEVTTATLFHHFATKEQLYLAAYEHGVNMAYARYREVVVGADSLAEEFRRVLETVDGILAERASIALLAVRVQIDQRRPTMHLLNRPAAASTFRDEIVERAIERGELDAVDTGYVHRMLDVFMWGTSVIGYEDAAVSREAVASLERLVEAAFPAPRARGTPRSATAQRSSKDRGRSSRTAPAPRAARRR